MKQTIIKVSLAVGLVMGVASAAVGGLRQTPVRRCGPEHSAVSDCVAVLHDCSEPSTRSPLRPLQTAMKAPPSAHETACNGTTLQTPLQTSAIPPCRRFLQTAATPIICRQKRSP
jgi:hypothetical protein